MASVHNARHTIALLVTAPFHLKLQLQKRSHEQTKIEKIAFVFSFAGCKVLECQLYKLEVLHVVTAAMFEGEALPSNMAAITITANLYGVCTYRAKVVNTVDFHNLAKAK